MIETSLRQLQLASLFQELQEMAKQGMKVDDVVRGVTKLLCAQRLAPIRLAATLVEVNPEQFSYQRLKRMIIPGGPKQLRCDLRTCNILQANTTAKA